METTDIKSYDLFSESSSLNFEEIWEDIPGYDGIYKISNYGRIRTTIRRGCSNEIMKLQKNRKGYPIVTLRKEGHNKTYFVHRLVAKAFVVNMLGFPEINHIDEDKSNNRFDNLEWCDRYYNTHYGTGAKRGIDKLCKELRKYDFNGKLIARYKSINGASRKLGLDSSCIIRCCRGELKTYRGFIWLLSENFSQDELSKRIAWLGHGNNKAHSKRRRLYQFSPDRVLIRTYNSLREAERLTGFSSSDISVAINRRTGFSHGFYWQYED